MSKEKESETLARLKLRDGTFIDFYRDADKTVRVNHEGIEIKLPHGTGLNTIQLFALLEPLGETIIEEDTDG
jgi:hypothetical protein